MAMGNRRVIQILTSLILACAILYARLFIPGQGNGADFADFYAGAVTDAHHGDPYVLADAWKIQRVLFFPPTYAGPPQVYTLKNPPPFTLLLRPFTHLIQNQAYWVWVAIEFVACGAGAFLLLSTWPLRARLLGVVVISLSPVALWNIRVGQVSMLLALSLGLAVYWMIRDKPLLAGAVMSLGMVKPHLMLPIAIVLLLASPKPARRPLALAFLVAVAGWVIVGLAFDGGMTRYVHYVQSITTLSGSGNPFADQADLAAIPGLFYAVFPPRLSGILTVLGVLLACMMIVLLARQSAGQGAWGRSRLLGGGIVLCFAFLPYEHTSDQILLALPLFLLIGSDGAGLAWWPVRLAAAASVLTPLVLFHDHTIEGPNVLPAICLLTAYALVRPSQVLGFLSFSRAPANRFKGGADLPL